jgi:hypothetical protein
MLACSSRKVAISTAIAVTFCVLARADGDRGATQQPRLQRISVAVDRAYFFRFDTPRGSDTPALIEVATVSGAEKNTITYYLFGGLRSIHTDRCPFRWSSAHSALFCTQFVIEPPPFPGAPGLYRYPLDALVAGPDDGRLPIDDSRIDPGFLQPGALPPPNYVGCNPIGEALQGFHRGWKEGKNRVGDPAKVVHYDIRALDDTRVELYMTADGELWKWLFDGKTWERQRGYDFRVEGEFLVFDEGHSIIAEQDGKWCIVRDIGKENATCDPIVDRVEGEPLTLVEDKVEQKNFFLHRDRLLDDTGRELFTARASRDHTDRLHKVIDFVLSRRQPRP